MRTSVAILETRPETVVQDYGRLLKLTGFKEVLEMILAACSSVFILASSRAFWKKIAF